MEPAAAAVWHKARSHRPKMAQVYRKVRMVQVTIRRRVDQPRSTGQLVRSGEEEGRSPRRWTSDVSGPSARAGGNTLYIACSWGRAEREASHPAPRRMSRLPTPGSTPTGRHSTWDCGSSVEDPWGGEGCACRNGSKIDACLGGGMGPGATLGHLRSGHNLVRTAHRGVPFSLFRRCMSGELSRLLHCDRSKKR